MPGMMNSMDHSQMNSAVTMVRPMSFPTKEKPSNSVIYSARSPRRIAMQYMAKPAPRITFSKEVRMVTKVERKPVSPAKADTIFKTSRSPQYSAVMALGETWAPESISRTSAFIPFLSISSAVMDQDPPYVLDLPLPTMHRQIQSITFWRN